ncbi:MAG: hypothetical protein ABFS14_11455 [Gemmatimonadota bacterium]
MRKSLPVTVALTFLAACGSPFDAPSSRPGTIFYDHEEGLAIEVPDSARARHAFDISVTTSGDGCVSFGGTEVQVTQRTVDFRPFDLHNGEDLCFSIQNLFEHRASVQFNEPGHVAVRIHGQFRIHPIDGGETQMGDTVIVRSVEVHF